MKKYLHIILTALAVLPFVACQEEEDVYKPEVKDITVVSVKDLVFLPTGGTGTITVDCTSSFTATADKAWCTVSVSGNEVTVTATNNPSIESRYATVLMKTSQSSQTVVVEQLGEVLDGMDLEDDLIDQKGTTLIYKYSANIDVEMFSDKDWIHFEKMQDEEDGTYIKVTVDPNPGLTRFATVTYVAGSRTKSVEFHQYPTPTLVSGWDISITDGSYVFPNQVDVVTVTPPNSSVLYHFELMTKEKTTEDAIGEDAIIIGIFEEVRIEYLMQTGRILSPSEYLKSGSYSEQQENLPRSIWAVAIVFDERGYLTGEYYYKDLQVPDRGPVKKLVDGWEVTHTGSYEHPAQTDVFTITPKAGYEDVKYIATTVKKSDVAEVEDFAFSTFALGTREELLAKVASGDLPNFEAGLSKGVTQISVENQLGDVYVVVVAFGDDQFYTGDYTYVEFALEDLQPYIYKWVGKWSVSRKNSNYDVVDTWVITMKEGGETLLIQGIEGFTNPARYDAEATVDEEGRLVLKTQYTGSYEDSSRGTVNVLLSGQYTNVQGKSYYTSSTGTVLFRGEMSSDFNSAELVPGTVTSAGEPATFATIQYYGRYTNSSGGTSAITWTAGPTQLPQTITRVVE